LGNENGKYESGLEGRRGADLREGIGGGEGRGLEG